MAVLFLLFFILGGLLMAAVAFLAAWLTRKDWSHRVRPLVVNRIILAVALLPVAICLLFFFLFFFISLVVV